MNRERCPQCERPVATEADLAHHVAGVCPWGGLACEDAADVWRARCLTAKAERDRLVRHALRQRDSHERCGFLDNYESTRQRDHACHECLDKESVPQRYVDEDWVCGYHLALRIRARESSGVE